MLKIHMLPADHGDCLWLEYGVQSAPKVILIDAGPVSAWPRLKAKINEEKRKRGGKLHLELFVVTHVDADHIGGAVKFLEEASGLGVTFGDVWFNGYFHLDNKVPPPRDDILGAKQGEQLSALIDGWGLPWNKAFDSKAVMVQDDGQLPTASFGQMKLTLLSPTLEKLQDLKPKWEAEIAKAGLVPGDAYEARDVEWDTSVAGREEDDLLGDDIERLAESVFKGDAAEANGSSIAFLAEYAGNAVLFGADAHTDVLMKSLGRLPNMRSGTLAISAFKLPHHGSRNNIDSLLLKAVPAKHYLVSTSGAQFRHPHPEAIARIAVYGPHKKTLHFNYRTEFNEQWDSASWKSNWNYSTAFGASDIGLIVSL
ncbi:ComEC/Rec2 family competence protein [Paraburkholderia sp. MM5482-R1]|uniref:ComEC/Rec2 family competence protein n=1 Tax=unclassified Paraburkholderia TaxID=2615204 RepID=UPI003D23BAA3